MPIPNQGTPPEQRGSPRDPQDAENFIPCNDTTEGSIIDPFSANTNESTEGFRWSPSSTYFVNNTRWIQIKDLIKKNPLKGFLKNPSKGFNQNPFSLFLKSFINYQYHFFFFFVYYYYQKSSSKYY